MVPELGFQPLQHSKGLYVDGHERADVVKYRETFLQKLEELENIHSPPPSVEDPVPFIPSRTSEGTAPLKHLVIIHHDKSTFHANDDQMRMWGEPDTHMIRPKSREAGLMISDFIEEFVVFLRLSDEQYDGIHDEEEKPSKKEAREMLHYGAE